MNLGSILLSNNRIMFYNTLKIGIHGHSSYRLAVEQKNSLTNWQVRLFCPKASHLTDVSTFELLHGETGGCLTRNHFFCTY